MLHMDYHEIMFRKTPSGYKWIWEQEIYIGPKLYETPDGMTHEQIAITYQIVKFSGVALNRSVVQYTGKDPRLLKNHPVFNDDLTLSDVRPIIKEWESEAANHH
jgi:hypothetical protein